MRFSGGDSERNRTQDMEVSSTDFGLTIQEMMKMRRRR